MAKPTTIKGSKFLIQLEDTPGVFVAPCALTTKGIDFSAETNDSNVPDCDDPDAPTFTERTISALSASISGSGTLAMESLATWRTWFESGLEKNIRVKVDATLANGGGYWAMSAVLTGFNLGAPLKDLMTVEVAIQSNGAWTWTDAGA
jgi:predicted secreted protein